MTAIEDGVKLRAVRQRAVVLQEIIIGYCAFLGPVKVVWDQALIHVIDHFRGIVIRELRAMAAVEKHAFLSIGGSLEEPVNSLSDRGAGRAFIQDHANVLGREANFLENAAHEENIVHAAIEA